jgi:hypothetical protein
MTCARAAPPIAGGTTPAIVRAVPRVVAVLSIVSFAALALAQPTSGVDPLLAAHDTDALELARVVDRIGDAAVLARLTPETPTPVRALAVVAATRMHAPEDALAPLAEIAAGRDPDLAPRAAQSILAIARSIDERSLDARERDRADLAPARGAIAAIAADETARADLRRACQLADAALADLQIPSPP